MKNYNTVVVICVMLIVLVSILILYVLYLRKNKKRITLYADCIIELPAENKKVKAVYGFIGSKGICSIAFDYNGNACIDINED